MFRRIAVGAVSLFALTLPALAQGPVILMGIDAEDGGVGAHGPISAYEDAIGNGLVPNVTNGGAGILVLGGGKNPGDNVTTWWNQLGADLGLPISFANGVGGIDGQTFVGFAVVAIASSVSRTASGGLTDAENGAVAGRAADIATHVNGGGGLFGTSQAGLSVPYGYLGSVGAFSFAFPTQFADITATAEGMSVGITNTNLDICCWHDEYLTFPGFLEILATNNDTGNPCAIGGLEVIIVQGIVLTPLMATNPVGTSHEVTATVADGMGQPVVGAIVDFNIIAGPHVGEMGSDVTDVNGEATFSWFGTMAGIDTIEACFEDNMGVTQCATATKEWIMTCFMLDFETEDDFSTPLSNGQDIDIPDEFGVLVNIMGMGSNAGAAIFDSTSGGPNDTGYDKDLLVDCGNIVILQNSNYATQTVAGTFDVANDDEDGGTIGIMFTGPVAPVSVDLVDIDAGTGEASSVVLTDETGLTRTYTVPAGWTGDLLDDGTGKLTLALEGLLPQPGLASTATAVEDAGFNRFAVVIMDVNLGSSGGIDNLSWCGSLSPVVSPEPKTTRTRRAPAGQNAGGLLGQ